MNKLEVLVKHLKEKFKPVGAIILHGSRARGKARKHSDWDFIVLLDHEIKNTGGREIVDGENIEFIIKQIPIPKEKIIDFFDSKLQDAQVVFDTAGDGERLVKEAQVIYQNGYLLNEEDFSSRNAMLLSHLDGMIDYKNEPSIFLKHHTNFYLRVINYWFHIKRAEFSKNLYDALPIIEKEDPQFYEELRVLWDCNSSAAEKIEAGRKALSLLFSKRHRV